MTDKFLLWVLKSVSLFQNRHFIGVSSLFRLDSKMTNKQLPLFCFCFSVPLSVSLTPPSLRLTWASRNWKCDDYDAGDQIWSMMTPPIKPHPWSLQDCELFVFVFVWSKLTPGSSKTVSRFHTRVFSSPALLIVFTDYYCSSYCIYGLLWEFVIITMIDHD